MEAESLRETPLEFRTPKFHYRIWRMCGVIRVYHLKPSQDGKTLEVGKVKIEMKRDEMKKRRDILSAMHAALGEWLR